MPRIDDDNKLITIPGRVYYFDNGELHCYDTKRGEDIQIDGYDGVGSTWGIYIPWYDSASDCVFFVENAGGMEIASQTVYQVSNTHKALPMITLTGGYDDVDIDVTDDYIYLKGWVDEFSPVNLLVSIKVSHSVKYTPPV